MSIEQQIETMRANGDAVGLRRFMTENFHGDDDVLAMACAAYLAACGDERQKTLECIAMAFIELAESAEYDGANDPSIALDAAKRLFPNWDTREMPLPC